MALNPNIKTPTTAKSNIRYLCQLFTNLKFLNFNASKSTGITNNDAESKKKAEKAVTKNQLLKSAIPASPINRIKERTIKAFAGVGNPIK